MTTEPPDGRVGPIDAIFRALDDPAWGRRHLPRLVGLLSHDEVRVRVGAGWAITYVAAEHPDTAEYLVRRLGDRLTQDPTVAVEQAFLGVAGRHPDVAEAELPEVLDSGDSRAFERSVGGMLRADYAMGGDRNRDVGRVRLPRGEAADTQGRVYSDDNDGGPREEDEAPTGSGLTDEEGSDSAADEADGPGEEGASDEDDGDGPTDAGDERGGRPARELWAGTNTLAVIAANCRFDDLAVMAQRHSGRYADTYRTRADLDGEELAVALLLFHPPEDLDEADVGGYVDDLHGALARWDRVDDAEAVLTLYDWGEDPRPWALVEYANDTLWDRDRLFSDTALWNARHLATALAHGHENGVVHGGLDPGNVAYYGNLLDASERQVPKLTNVGLLPVLRQYFDPTEKLDPRYAAPEYFDRDYGRVDHATDIYGLGAICYHLFTGRPPYTGDYAAVREAVLSESTPVPSEVADVPDGVDEIVGKAMATKKFHRYEGVTHMAADLRDVAGGDAAEALLEGDASAASTPSQAEGDDGAPASQRGASPDAGGAESASAGTGEAAGGPDGPEDTDDEPKDTDDGPKDTDDGPEDTDDGAGGGDDSDGSRGEQGAQS